MFTFTDFINGYLSLIKFQLIFAPLLTIAKLYDAEQLGESFTSLKTFTKLNFIIGCTPFGPILEEYIFRYFFVNVLKIFSIKITNGIIIILSILFGLTHITNYILCKSYKLVFLQCVHTFLLSLVLYNIDNLDLAILLHWVYNITGFILCCIMDITFEYIFLLINVGKKSSDETKEIITDFIKNKYVTTCISKSTSFPNLNSLINYKTTSIFEIKSSKNLDVIEVNDKLEKSKYNYFLKYGKAYNM